MSRTVAFAYPGARVQARYGQLLSESQWERLLRSPDFGLFVQNAHHTPLRPWVLNLESRTETHQIEAHLRAQFRLRVRGVAAWAPPDWRPAVRWVELLPDLPAAAHTLTGASVYPWIGADAALGRFVSSAVASVREAAGAAVLTAAWTAGRELLAAWLDRWRALWPAIAAEDRAALDQLTQLLLSALPSAPAGRAAPAPARLQAALRRLFRRHTRAPAGLFAYLGLLWLEQVRIRGALLRRRLSLPVEEVPA